MSTTPADAFDDLEAELAGAGDRGADIDRDFGPVDPDVVLVSRLLKGHTLASIAADDVVSVSNLLERLDGTSRALVDHDTPRRRALLLRHGLDRLAGLATDLLQEDLSGRDRTALMGLLLSIYLERSRVEVPPSAPRPVSAFERAREVLATRKGTTR